MTPLQDAADQLLLLLERHLARLDIETTCGELDAGELAFLAELSPERA